MAEIARTPVGSARDCQWGWGHVSVIPQQILCSRWWRASRRQSRHCVLRPGSQLAHRRPCYIPLAIACKMVNPDSWVGKLRLPLHGRSYKVTLSRMRIQGDRVGHFCNFGRQLLPSSKRWSGTFIFQTSQIPRILHLWLGGPLRFPIALGEGVF